jgi:hypothetical protein
MISDGITKIKNTDNQTINNSLFLPKWRSVGMTDSKNFQYTITNQYVTLFFKKR